MPAICFNKELDFILHVWHLRTWSKNGINLNSEEKRWTSKFVCTFECGQTPRQKCWTFSDVGVLFFSRWRALFCHFCQSLQKPTTNLSKEECHTCSRILCLTHNVKPISYMWTEILSTHARRYATRRITQFQYDISTTFLMRAFVGILYVVNNKMCDTFDFEKDDQLLKNAISKWEIWYMKNTKINLAETTIDHWKVRGC